MLLNTEQPKMVDDKRHKNVGRDGQARESACGQKSAIRKGMRGRPLAEDAEGRRIALPRGR